MFGYTAGGEGAWSSINLYTSVKGVMKSVRASSIPASRLVNQAANLKNRILNEQPNYLILQDKNFLMRYSSSLSPRVFTEPPIVTGIMAAAMNSSVITVSNWAPQSSGACTIHYDSCICLSSASCSPSGLATSSDSARECKSNLAEGALLLSFNNHYMS